MNLSRTLRRSAFAGEAVVAAGLAIGASAQALTPHCFGYALRVGAAVTGMGCASFADRGGLPLAGLALVALAVALLLLAASVRSRSGVATLALALQLPVAAASFGGVMAWSGTYQAANAWCAAGTLLCAVTVVATWVLRPDPGRRPAD